jgi:hypothetical protein
VNCRGAPYLLDLARDFQVERIVPLEVLSGYVCKGRSFQNNSAGSWRSSQRHLFKLDLGVPNAVTAVLAVPDSHRPVHGVGGQVVGLAIGDNASFGERAVTSE